MGKLQFSELIEDLFSAKILPIISMSVVIGVLLIIFGVSFASMIFSGDLAPFASRAAGLTLAGCFFICGVTANGLIGTHLIPHAIERGIPQVTAAAAVGIMGGASFVGTTFSGYLVDRIDPRKVLAVVYALRGTALLMLPFVSDATGLFMFAVLYGLDWYASGPATTTIIARVFGSERVGSIFGTVFVFHQLGGASAAILGGWVRVHFGDYQYAFLIGGCLGLIAACLALSIDRRNVEKSEVRAATEFTGA